MSQWVQYGTCASGFDSMFSRQNSVVHQVAALIAAIIPMAPKSVMSHQIGHAFVFADTGAGLHSLGASWVSLIYPSCLIRFVMIGFLCALLAMVENLSAYLCLTTRLLLPLIFESNSGLSVATIIAY